MMTAFYCALIVGGFGLCGYGIVNLVFSER